jgi:hypothetical protein
MHYILAFPLLGEDPTVTLKEKDAFSGGGIFSIWHTQRKEGLVILEINNPSSLVFHTIYSLASSSTSVKKRNAL